MKVDTYRKLSCQVLLLTVLLLASNAGANIVATKHNLSVSGPGTITATTEDRVCIFCHTPHHATAVTPLWSRKSSNAIYDLYASSSLIAQPGQPTGGSRLCLSCHDGTIAVGMLEGLTEPITMTGGITTLPPGATNLETDLSDDHPISFAYTSTLAAQRGELADPSQLPSEIKLEDGQMLQCTSCHNPHKDPHGMFLVMNNAGSALCISCHTKTDWANNAHATDLEVSEQACENCHQPHGAPGSSNLLQGAAEEDTCLANCHNPLGPGIDIQTDADKFYSHPVDSTTGIHDVTENPLTMSAHVECSDCHNPHRVNGTNAPLAAAPAVNGRMTAVKGVNSLGVAVTEAAYEYEICFGCHADNAVPVSGQISRIITQDVVVQEGNERWRFDSANPSYHPVIAPGKNLNVPSLRPEYTESSQIYCSDCHGSDSSVRAGGVGADGPHGSIYPHILMARYEQDTYPLTYSVSNYALCFRCHDPDALFSPMVSTFGNSHKSHVQTKGVPCSACHDPHGVPALSGATTTANAHLISFDVRFVDPATASYDSVAKSCNVSCHQMNPRRY